ncbi:MAG: hypothetical protein AAGN46_10635 [Acidobacteriota bacterium]
MGIATSLALTLAYLGWCWTVGRSLRRSIDRQAVPPKRGVDRRLGDLALDIALGKAIAVLLLLTAASLHALRPAPILCLGIAGLVLAARLRRTHGVRAGHGATARALPSTTAEPRTPSFGATVGIALMVLPLGLLALYPQTGFDVTAYHLPFAASFADAGRFVVLPWLRYPIFPQAAELQTAALLVLGGDERIAALQQFVAFLATAGLLLIWPLDGRDPSRRLRRWAAAFWLGTPLAVWIGTQGYVDVELSLFVGAACVVLARDDGRTLGPSAVAGLLLGTAAATKYLGLYFATALCAWPLITRWRRGSTADSWRSALGRCAAIGLGAAVAAAPWIARLLGETGNPVFPFASGLFGESLWTQSGAPSRRTGLGFGESGLVLEPLIFIFAFPWLTLAERHLFAGQAPLSPAALVALPLAAWGAWRRPTLRPWALLLIPYLAIWLEIGRDTRYLLPILPLVALLMASGLDALLPRRRGWGLAVGLALLLPGVVYAGFKAVERGPLPLDAQTRQDDLERQIPGYAAIRRLDAAADAHPELRGYRMLAIYGERLASTPRHGATVGDHFGPAAYSTFLPLREHPRLLATTLHGFEVCFLLTPHRVIPRPPPDGLHFRAVWSDGEHRLDLRLAPDCPPADLLAAELSRY